MRRRITGGIYGIPGILAVSALAAGCASSSTAGTPPVAPATSAAQSAAQSPAPPATSSGSGPASPNVAGQQKCAAGDLQVKIGGSEGAAGSVYVTIDFTNSSSASCTLYGYPGVSLTGGNPAAQIGAAAGRDHSKMPALVTLAPGSTASAVVQVVQAGNYPAATCDPEPASALLVYPPDQASSVSLPYATTGCASTSVVILHVSPVTAG